MLLTKTCVCACVVCVCVCVTVFIVCVQSLPFHSFLPRGFGASRPFFLECELLVVWAVKIRRTVLNYLEFYPIGSYPIGSYPSGIPGDRDLNASYHQANLIEKTILRLVLTPMESVETHPLWKKVRKPRQLMQTFSTLDMEKLNFRELKIYLILWKLTVEMKNNHN